MNTDTNRRDFIRTTTVVTLSAALAPGALRALTARIGLHRSSGNAGGFPKMQ